MNYAADYLGGGDLFGKKLDNAVIYEYPCTHADVTGQLLEADASHLVVAEHVLGGEGVGVAVVYLYGLVVNELAQTYLGSLCIQQSSYGEVKLLAELLDNAETLFVGLIVAV